MLAGICLLSLSNPMLLLQAGVGIAVISTGLDALPEGLPRDLGEAVVSMLPLLKARDVFGGKDPVDPAKIDADTDTKPDEQAKIDTETKPEETKPESKSESGGEEAPAEDATVHADHVREGLSAEAKEVFDQQRASAASDDEFLNRPGGESTSKYEAMAQKQADAAGKQAAQEAAMTDARAKLDSDEFLDRPNVQKALESGELGKVRAEIAVEMRRQALLEQYPPEQGYKVQEGVILATEQSGYSTAEEWAADNPDAPPGTVFANNGKVYKTNTDVDLMVTRVPPEGGPAQSVYMEQVKSGKGDQGTDAAGQNQVAADMLKRFEDGDPTVTMFQGGTASGTNITGDFDPAGASQIESGTSGPNQKQGFDKPVGLTTKQMDALEKEMRLQHAKGKNP